MDGISLAQRVAECGIVLGVPADTNTSLAATTGEGGHEVEEGPGHLNVTRVLSDYAPAFSLSFLFCWVPGGPTNLTHNQNSRRETMGGAIYGSRNTTDRYRLSAVRSKGPKSALYRAQRESWRRKPAGQYAKHQGGGF